MTEIKFLKNIEETDYKVKLSEFEGPLDLLLHLIKETKIDIKDIFISKITDQYLQYMEEIEDIDMEKSGDFIEMAATLLEIKSKKVLPKQVEEVPDEESEEVKLIRRLNEYKIMKEAAEKLKPLEIVNRFYKEPDEGNGDYRYILKDMKLDSLLDAFSKILLKETTRKKNERPRQIEKDRFTVAQKIAQIKDVLIEKEQVMFTELFEQDYTKSEIINTFLAILELLKRQVITANQTDTFADIQIAKKEVVNG